VSSAPATYRCLVSSPIDDARRERLRAACRRIEAEHFDTRPSDVEVAVTEIEAGRWFTSAEPSHATFITVTVPDDTEQQQRVALMTGIGAAVAEALDQQIHDVMVVAADGRRTRN
jgi:phenylpyruvate tautomerase PptA (4-oxalocrotonate tautomerase family)